MAITISGENNNDRILATDGVIDQISGFSVVGVMTATSFTGDLTGNVTGNVTGNLTGNVNNTSPLLLQTGGYERFRITGNNELGIAGANYGSAGQVLTSGGSGSAVSWTTIPTQVTISSNANNRLITGGSGTNLIGETRLTFDGAALSITGAGSHPFSAASGDYRSLSISGNSQSSSGFIYLGNGAATNNADFDLGRIRIHNGATEVALITGTTDTSANDDGRITLHTRNTGGSLQERLRITSTGRVGINEISPDGQLHIKDTNPRIILEGTNGSGRQHEIWSSGGNSQALQFTSGELYYNADIHVFRASNESTHYGRIDSSGRFLIGTSSVYNANSYSNNLVIYENGDTGMSILGNNSNSNYSSLYFSDTSTASRAFFEAQLGANGNFTIGTNGTGPIRFTTSSGEAVRIQGERVIIGHTATDDRDGYNSSLQVSGTSGDDTSISIGRWSNDQSSPGLVFSKSRSTTIGSHSALTGSEYLGAIQFQGDDGSNYHVGASIQARVENFSGGVGTDDMPTRLMFNTNIDAANVTGRMIIHGRGSEYNVLYGGRVDILGYEGRNITGGANSNILNEQFLVCPSASDGYDDSHTITFGQTKGNWESGTSSAYNTSWGLMWHYGGQYNSTRELRAGIHYDHKGQERFKFWSSYGDIIFRTRSSSQGSRTSEECDQEPLRITDTNRVGINRGGTASVDETLDVDGGARFRSYVYIGDGFYFKSNAFGGNTNLDTGISINQGGRGGCGLLLVSRNYNNGTGTSAGIYRIKWYYDGNNAPATHHMSGDNFISFGVSGSNTLTINGGGGNQLYGIINVTA